MFRLRMGLPIIFCFLASIGFAASKPFEIKAQIFGKTEFVQGTPANIVITIRNISGGNQIQVFEGLWYKDGQPCGNVIEEVMPSSDKQVIVDPPIVPKDWNAKFSYNIAEYCELAQPGTYELEYRVPLGFHGSPPVDPLKITIKIIEASKEEKEVYDFLQACYSNLKQVNLGRVGANFLKNHPNSIYTAWIILPYLGEPEKYQPEIAKSILEMPNEYPSGNVVPDPESGSRDIPYGERNGNWNGRSGFWHIIRIFPLLSDFN